jgi:hypothetical protein
MNLELFDTLCRDIENRPTSSSLEADQARSVLRDYELYSRSDKSMLPHPIRSGKTIGEVQEESLRRRMASFLNAAL